MARIIGGIGASHSPTIGFAKDTGKQNDPAWKPIFDGFDAIRGWVQDKKIDVIFMIYNDHITSFFLDHYSAFVLGIDDRYEAADEGGGPREVALAMGHLGLSQHIGHSLVADELFVAPVHAGRRARPVAGPGGALAGRRAAIARAKRETHVEAGPSPAPRR